MILFQAMEVEKELPPYPQIVVVLIASRIPMMAQIRPSENGPEWWTLGMASATRIEEKKKCVTHWLKPTSQTALLSDNHTADMEEAFNESRLTHPMVGFKHDTFQDYLKWLEKK